MPELLLHTSNGEERISFDGTPLLYDLIAHLPDAPDRPCGGNGSCGACAVLAEGSILPPPNESGKVRSCCSTLTGNAEIWIPSRAAITQIESSGIKSHFEYAPLQGRYGAAVDLGTTTIVLELVDLQSGQTLSIVSGENPQRIFSADVIGRINHALHGKGLILQTLVRDCIDKLERLAFQKAGLDGVTADWRVIAGNTTMLYLYQGKDPSSLAASPFVPDCLFGESEGRDIFPACSGAFVGADITCAILASGMCRKNETALMIDIGTNGEIALWHNDQLTCCATAAGPAFEGCGIACGKGSIPGAIDSVSLVNGRLHTTTIRSAPVCGICGSGLIDLVAALLDLEMLDETGYLDETIQFANDVYLEQQDIRQVQLAKSAIAAGIQTLLSGAGVSANDLSALYIAGGFGSHLNLRSAARIGLIPYELTAKAVVLGNASLSGARQMLLSAPAHAEALSITRSAQCINLASQPGFNETFIECMLFEE